MKFPSKEIVQRIREKCPPGSRVELLSMADPYTDIPPGTMGTVTCIDDTGTVFVKWDTGSSLGVVYGVDFILTEEEAAMEAAVNAAEAAAERDE